MEFQEHHEEAELGLPTLVAPTSYEEFGMPLNHGEEEPTVEVVPMAMPMVVPVATPTNIVAKNNSKGKYQECLRNHDVKIGGHTIDGCIKFQPGGEGDALKCVVCNCHRNFHRKETPEGTYLVPVHPHPQPHPPPPPPVPFAMYYHAPAGYLHMMGHHRATLAHPSLLGGGVTLEDSDPKSGATTHGGSGSSSKKRFRTQFTQQQKDKMLVFAEKLGWRMQKHDESVVQEFCSEIGVQRQVLKVWMHNNKHTLGKKP